MIRIARQYTMQAVFTDTAFAIVGILIIVFSETTVDVVCGIIVTLLNLISTVFSIRDYKKINKYVEVKASDLVKLSDFIKANNLTNEKKKEK